MADLFAKQPRPKGNRLTIMTNAGGPGVLATDALISNGGQLAQLSDETMKAFNGLLPAAWSHNNPVDILGDASPDRYAKALEIAAQDMNSDGMLVILTPQDMTDPTKTAEKLVPYAKSLGKPVLASWMGGAGVAAGEKVLSQADIPSFPYPDTAARMFDYMASYAGILDRLYETPTLAAYSLESPPDRKQAEDIIQIARDAGRTLLTEHESKQLLAAYRIPTVETRIAHTEEEAVQAADGIGYPVVLKLHSETISHKTDVGGVLLNLKDGPAIRQAFRQIAENLHAKVGDIDKSGHSHFLGVTVQPMIKQEGYELILGSSIDSQFGPVILFGLGGQLVEVFKDSSLSLPPLTDTLARRMMERTRIYTALKGVRGRASVDLKAVEQLVVRFSTLIAEQRWIKELDINPLLAAPERLVALDARVVIYGKDVQERELPRLAIRPYPTQYISEWTANNGKRLTFRPVRAEDEPYMMKFHESLSDRSVYLRFLQPKRLSDRANHDRLSRICHSDYDNEIALIVEDPLAGEGQLRVLAASRMSKLHGTNAARLSMLVSDSCQGLGIGRELMRRLIEVARQEKLIRLEILMTQDNLAMQVMCKSFGFEISDIGDGLKRADMKL
jgi:acetyltransferase